MWQLLLTLTVVHALNDWNKEPSNPKWTSCIKKKLNPLKWMCQLQTASNSNTSPKLNTLNLPGTHDSAAKSGMTGITPDAVCQYADINKQLEMGYRWFDLRVIYNPLDKHFWMVHYNNKFINWDQLHTQLKTFRTNSGGTECVILSVKNELGKEKYWKKSIYPNRALNKQDFAVPLIEKIKKYQNSNDETDRIYYVQHKSAPSIKECKGRVILLGQKGTATATEWHHDDVWKAFNRLGSNWIDSKPKDSKNWNLNWASKTDRGERLLSWKKSLTAINNIKVENIGAMQFYRSEINANSMRNDIFKASDYAKKKCKCKNGKCKWKKDCGIPLDWSIVTNPGVVKEIISRSFNAGNCVQKFDGTIAIDMPKKNLKGKEIAKAIILSNCVLHKKFKINLLSNINVKSLKKKFGGLFKAKYDVYSINMYEDDDYDAQQLMFGGDDDYDSTNTTLIFMQIIIALSVMLIMSFICGICGVLAGFTFYFIAHNVGKMYSNVY